MADGIEVKLKGIPDLKRALAQVPEKLQRKGLQKGLRLAGNIVRDAARGAASLLKEPTPYRKRGTVRRNIVVRPSKFSKRAGNLGVFVGVRPLRGRRTKRLGVASAKNPNDPFYWHFLEFGTRKMARRPMLSVGAGRLGQAADVVINEATQAIHRINTGAP